LTNQFGTNERLIAKAQTEVSTTDASVLRETDSWPERELGSFDLADRRFHYLAKLPALLIGNRSQEILNFRNTLSHESYNGDIRDASDPGVANQLEVKRRQSLGLIRVTSAGSFPFEQSLFAVQRANSIDIGHEFVSVCEWANELLLHVVLRLANANSVISSELFP